MRAMSKEKGPRYPGIPHYRHNAELYRAIGVSDARRLRSGLSRALPEPELCSIAPRKDLCGCRTV